MDDTILFANLVALTDRLIAKHGWDPRYALEQAMRHLIKTYSAYLWTSGGNLALEKCYWYALRFYRQKNGMYKLLPIKHTAFNSLDARSFLSEIYLA